jgi:hypothetical protein
MMTRTDQQPTAVGYASLPVEDGKVTFEVVVNEHKVLTFYLDDDWEKAEKVVARTDERLVKLCRQNRIKPSQFAYDIVVNNAALDYETRCAMALWLMTRMTIWPTIPPTRPDHIRVNLNTTGTDGVMMTLQASHRITGMVQ